MKAGIVIVVVVAALSLGGGLYWLSSTKSLVAFEEFDLANLPTVEYCQLRRTPSDYEWKVIRLNGELWENTHGIFFQDRQCTQKSYEELTDDWRMAVSMFEPRRESLWKAIRETRLAHDEKLGGQIRVTAIGRFTRRYPVGLHDGIEQRTSFHFELFSIEHASLQGDDRLSGWLF